MEGKELEEESLVIDKRIREIELKFEPKPLPILTFKKPIENLTWLSLGESIIHMHNYMSENKISYISEIDLVKSYYEKNLTIEKNANQDSTVNVVNNFEEVFKTDGDNKLTETNKEKEISEVEDNEADERMEVDNNDKSPEKMDTEKSHSVDVASSQEEEESDYQKSETDNQETKECSDFNADGTLDKSTGKFFKFFSSF